MPSDLPPRPVRPTRPEASPPSRGSFLSVFLALVVLICGIGGLLFLPLMNALWGILILFGVLLLQYYVWGWWLGPYLRRTADEENDAP